MISIPQLVLAPPANIRIPMPAITICTVAVIVCALATVSLAVPGTSFRSPDEHASYLFTKTMGETGSLSYTRDYLQGDAENLLHPRGAITHDGNAVPFNYLGSYVLYVPAYLVLGENTRYIAIPLALLTIVSLAATGAVLIPKHPWVAWIAILGASPIVYYANRPFLNTLPAMAFLAFGIALLFRYFRARSPTSWRWLAGGSAAFAIAAFARYEYVIFEGLFMGIFLLHKHRLDVRDTVRDMAIFSSVVLVLFIVPVLILNQLTYGSPLTFGYGLFNEAYFPSRSGDGSLLTSIGPMVRSVLLPAYPFDLGLAGNAFINQMLRVAPVFAAVALMGLIGVAWRRAIQPRFLLAYLALGVYIFLYRGAGYSWLADSSTPDFEASIVRYVLPLYMACYLLAVYALAQIDTPYLAGGLAIAVAIAGVFGVMHGVDGNLIHIRTQVRAGDELMLRDVVPNTEPDSLIYTDIFDKTIGPYRDVASWWGGVRGTHEGFFQPSDVARSMSRVVGSRPIYLYVFEEDYIVPSLNPALEAQDLKLISTGIHRLYAVEQDLSQPTDE